MGRARGWLQETEGYEGLGVGGGGGLQEKRDMKVWGWGGGGGCRKQRDMKGRREQRDMKGRRIHMKVGWGEGNRGAVVYNMLSATVYIIFF